MISVEWLTAALQSRGSVLNRLAKAGVHIGRLKKAPASVGRLICVKFHYAAINPEAEYCDICDGRMYQLIYLRCWIEETRFCCEHTLAVFCSKCGRVSPRRALSWDLIFPGEQRFPHCEDIFRLLDDFRERKAIRNSPLHVPYRD